MEKKGVFLQDIQNLTVFSKFNFVSVKEEPPEEMSSESEVMHFENPERQFQVNPEGRLRADSVRPLVCIYKVLATV
jgi:hypothetical protein